MAVVKIKALSPKGLRSIQRQYETQKGSTILMVAFKTAGLRMEFINGALLYAKKGGINKENLPQITGFLKAEGLKENFDYKIEVTQ